MERRKNKRKRKDENCQKRGGLRVGKRRNNNNY